MKVKYVKPLKWFKDANYAVGYGVTTEEGGLRPACYIPYYISRSGMTVELAFIQEGSVLIFSIRHLYGMLKKLRTRVDYPPAQIIIVEGHPALWMTGNQELSNFSVFDTDQLFNLIDKFKEFRLSGKPVIMEEKLPKEIYRSIRVGSLIETEYDDSAQKFHLTYGEGLNTLSMVETTEDGGLYGKDWRGWEYTLALGEKIWLVKKQYPEYHKEQEECDQDFN